MKKKSLISLLCLMFLVLPLSYCSGQGLSKEEIIQLAIVKANELGYDTEEMDVFYDEGNTELQKIFLREGVPACDEEGGECLQGQPGTPEEKYPSLVNRNYQNVYFRTRDEKEVVLGADLWIFVDKDIGEIINWMSVK